MNDEAIKVQRGTVIGILREQEAGAATAHVCRKHGISTANFYSWLLAEAMLDNAMLKDLTTEKFNARRET